MPLWAGIRVVTVPSGIKGVRPMTHRDYAAMDDLLHGPTLEAVMITFTPSPSSCL